MKPRNEHQNCFASLILYVFLAVLSGRLYADAPVTITPDSKSPGKQISPDFCGVSFETKMVLPDQGKYFFSADNHELIGLFKSLGIKSLRIGGNSADAATVKIPSEPDLDQLFAFATAANVKVIYNLRLKDEKDPENDVKLAKYLVDKYKPQINCFTIGNEPNMYFSEYAAYREQWKRFADAILSAVPDAQFNGPSTTPGKTAWAREFADDFAAWQPLRLVSQHSYPGGNAEKVPDPAAARSKILSSEMDKSYESFYQGFVPAVLKNHQRYRLEEANSLFHGGAAGVSNSYASALWALDYLHWWSQHDASGINFHTGNHRAADEEHIPGGYDISYSTPTGLKVHPIAYALKAFSFSDEGRPVPVSVKFQKEHINLTAYGVWGDEKTLRLTIINKESGDSAQEANVSIDVGAQYQHGEYMLLKSPDNDISLLSGTTLGDATIAGDGKWDGTWTPLSPSDASKSLTMHLPVATAAVIRLGTGNK